jgi:hypothetical protein
MANERRVWLRLCPTFARSHSALVAGLLNFTRSSLAPLDRCHPQMPDPGELTAATTARDHAEAIDIARLQDHVGWQLL